MVRLAPQIEQKILPENHLMIKQVSPFDFLEEGAISYAMENKYTVLLSKMRATFQSFHSNHSTSNKQITDKIFRILIIDKFELYFWKKKETIEIIHFFFQ